MTEEGRNVVDSLITLKEEDNNGIYMSLMSSILSFWMGRQAELEKK